MQLQLFLQQTLSLKKHIRVNARFANERAVTFRINYRLNSICFIYNTP